MAACFDILLKTHVRLLLAALLVPALATVLAWTLVPGILSSDSAAGFRTWESMLVGGPWNSCISPSTADLSKNTSEFVSWWSPGQYVFPGIFHALGLTWAHASLVVTISAIILSCLGVWRLSVHLGLSREQAALATLLVSIGCGTLQGFGMFAGGDIILAAAAPFLFLAASQLKSSPPIAGFVRFFCICLICLFCKHSGAIIILGTLFFLVIDAPQRQIGSLIRNKILYSASSAALLSYIFAQLIWVRGHATPASIAGSAGAHCESIGYALNAPWFALSGAGSLLSWVRNHIGTDSPAIDQSISWVLLAVGLGVTGLLARQCFSRSSSRAWRLAACCWLTCSFLMTALYLRGASVSLEERHFRPVAILLAIALASDAAPPCLRQTGKLAAITVTTLSIMFGLVSHARRISLLAHLPKSPVTGFSLPDLTPASITKINNVCPPNSVLAVLTSTQAMEFPNQRVFVTDAFFRPANEIADMRFSSAKLAVILPVHAGFEQDGRAAILRAAFVNIPATDWHAIQSDNWTIWSTSAARPSIGL